MSGQKADCFNCGELESLCKILGEINSGTEIGHFLAQIKVEDYDYGNTKWKRLFNALSKRQNVDQAGNKILSYINIALQPARYINNKEYYFNFPT